MPGSTFNRDFAFTLNDVARLMRTHADQEARRFGMTRAQWAVLARIEREQGLKQSELADMLDLAPITLTRLIDRLCDSGLIERRSDAQDRRAKRLHLTPAARPVLERLRGTGEEIMATLLHGIDRSDAERIKVHLETMKDNLRHAIQMKQTPDKPAAGKKNASKPGKAPVKELVRHYG